MLKNHQSYYSSPVTNYITIQQTVFHYKIVNLNVALEEKSGDQQRESAIAIPRATPVTGLNNPERSETALEKQCFFFLRSFLIIFIHVVVFSKHLVFSASSISSSVIYVVFLCIGEYLQL